MIQISIMCITYKSLCCGYISLETATVIIGILDMLGPLMCLVFAIIYFGCFDADIPRHATPLPWADVTLTKCTEEEEPIFQYYGM